MTYRGTLERVVSTNNNLRTQEVRGLFDELPTPGAGFLMFAPPLDPSRDVRRVETSHVVEIRNVGERRLEFETRNSTYKLTYSPEVEACEAD